MRGCRLLSIPLNPTPTLPFACGEREGVERLASSTHWERTKRLVSSAQRRGCGPEPLPPLRLRRKGGSRTTRFEYPLGASKATCFERAAKRLRPGTAPSLSPQAKGRVGVGLGELPDQRGDMMYERQQTSSQATTQDADRGGAVLVAVSACKANRGFPLPAAGTGPRLRCRLLVSAGEAGDRG